MKRTTLKAPVAPATVFDKFRDVKGYRQADQILRNSGYELLRVLTDPDKNAQEHSFEFWSGPKGVLILQLWKNGNGIHMYANWAVGHSWNELIDALSPKAGFQIGRRLTTLGGMNRIDVEYVGPGAYPGYFTGKVLHVGVPEQEKVKVGDIYSLFDYNYFNADLSDL